MTTAQQLHNSASHASGLDPNCPVCNPSGFRSGVQAAPAARPMAGQAGYRASAATSLILHVRQHQYQTKAHMISLNPSAAIDAIIALSHALDLAVARIPMRIEEDDALAIIRLAAEEIL